MSQPDSEPNQPDDERVVALHRATLTAVDFRRSRFDRFSLGGCLFDRCEFRGLKLDRRLAPLFVALPRSVFRDCHFDGADLRRARLGQSRFERCTFDDARLDGSHLEAAEFVDCRFAGPLDGVTFHGAPSGPEVERLDPQRRRNEFRGNDFRDAELLDVGFVAGVEMGRQRFPEDELYVRVEDFQRRLAKARGEVKRWYERDRAPGLVMLATLSARWRDQDVVVARRWTPRIKASDRVQARVWALLEHG
ncbi:MAG TPA: pentapeptide repeat-containing protein [Candidatus Limnocylindria bacterium]|nr:pentapeptide repeat-containing protein [Candidatus Limnocylindria bacterium]